jgi:DNA repair protein RecN (Recombination protein N)
MGEDEVLETEGRRLSHADELGRLARDLEQAVDAAGLARAAKLLTSLERLDPSTAAWRELLDGAFANINDLASTARDYAAGIDADPGRLAEVERRRDVIYRLMQKYGPAIPDVLAARDSAARELDMLDSADLDLRELASQRKAAEDEFGRATAALTAKRERGAKRLSRDVTAQLAALGMPGGSFVTSLHPLGAPRGDGAEAVSFLIRLNEGLDPRPLARVASGGELSRLMLALKVVLAEHDAVPTLVFDEVDQGIGGEVAGQVGTALAAVSRRGASGERQALVITHLPQIAVRADRQLAVSKSERGGVATSDVREVRDEARVLEVARMFGDQDSATARRHAEELLKTAESSAASRSETPSPPGRARPRR